MEIRNQGTRNRMGRKLGLLAATVAAILSLIALAAWLVSHRPQDNGEMPPSARPVRFGLPRQPASALALIAFRNELFAEHGVSIEETAYASGVRALQALLAGEVDVVTCADVPFALAAFTHLDLCVLASIATTDNESQIIARADRGIAEPKDLIGRRIGTQYGSAVHFFLHLFLTKHGIPETEADLVFLPAEQLAPALIAGDVDALAIREPYLGDAARNLLEKAVIFTEPGLYSRRELVVTTAEWRAQNGDVAPLLRALLDAQHYAAQSPEEAARTVAVGIGSAYPEIRDLWRQMELKVKLDQALLLALEDEARWLRETEIADADVSPDFLKMICPQPLVDLAPHAVTIIGMEAGP